MQERHSVTECAGAWHPVDQFDTRLVEPFQLGYQVFAPIRDVVEAGTPSRQKARYGSIRAEWFEEFDFADECDTDSLAFEQLGRGTGTPREEFIMADAIFDGSDGYGYVVERPRGREWKRYQRLYRERCGTTDRGDGMGRSRSLQGEPNGQ